VERRKGQDGCRAMDAVHNTVFTAKASPRSTERRGMDFPRRSPQKQARHWSVREVLDRICVITSSEIRNPEGDEPVKHWKNSAWDPEAGKASTTASVPGKPPP
jgi:hypothetical protein